MRFILAFILTFYSLTYTLYAENLVRDFELYKLNEGDKNAPTLLLMGGIHGDEPGAYYSTDLFLRHYKITRGSVWVVPVVNPHGMFANMRGVYGDMNRKFAALSQNDPDYESIQNIKKLLANPEIDISMHLHDGSGYWRPTYQSNLLNPHKWGNCSVVDQIRIDGKYGELESFVVQMVADINLRILNPIHRFHVHNTQTKAKNDVEQLKALTFFSLSLNKPALTNETSKELDVPTRVFYHLLAIESLLGQLGITFERDFELNVATIKTLLNTESLYAKIEDSIFLPLDSLRPSLTYFPLPKQSNLKQLKIESQSHLLGIVPNKNGKLNLHYGSRKLSTLSPQWYEFEHSLQNVKIKVDGELQSVPIGSIVYAKQSVEFEPLANHRVNVIGYVLPNDNNPLPNESGVTIHKKDFKPQYSLDSKASHFRAEFYRDNAFSGMIIISFAKPREKRVSTFQQVHYTPAPHSKTAKATDSKLIDSKAQPKIIESESTNTAPTILAVKSNLGLNLRAKPSTDSAILAKLPKYTQVKVLQQVGKWSKVSVDSIPQTKPTQTLQGYVISQALSNTLLPPQEQSQAQNTESAPQNTTKTPQNKEQDSIQNQSTTESYAKVIVNTAMVRAKPSTDSIIIAKAPKGRKMQILSFEKDKDNTQWAKIYYIFESQSGRREIQGYVAKRLLEPIP
ncbi:M99 family carboxypeptidase catalytic domain-containing protein [uncultured Helicobacter sp.]|uniref:M99 family carboxypeptidase catalytic domain-containing protein n=1 Tax=uncultured Helicobacter sp. TaxID=175537 RepID=UPI0025E4199D|nr:M99 family carboxypeptidase catalytic domain-containing protein [uncultured Helicobacter sp.]